MSHTTETKRDRSDAVSLRCVQLAPKIGSNEQNIERIEDEIRQAVTDRVNLLVLPELANSGYALTPSEARTAALPANSPVLRRWAELAGDSLTAVIGFCEDGGELVYNSAVILVPGSSPVIYRKLHLWDTEKLIFAPGSAAPPLVDTPFGKLGTVICYDLEFPEMPRSLALRGADVIAVPTNWPYIERPSNEHAPEVVQAMAAARASGVAVVCCDRGGDERGTRWTEGSCIVGPDGWIAAIPDASARATATVSLLQDRRSISERNHLLEDRRPGAYGPLAG